MALKWKKGNGEAGEMSFLEHLEELRWHIIRSIIAIVVFMIIAFMFKNIISIILYWPQKILISGLTITLQAWTRDDLRSPVKY